MSIVVRLFRCANFVSYQEGRHDSHRGIYAQI
jgi:hypothetical protein